MAKMIVLTMLSLSSAGAAGAVLPRLPVGTVDLAAVVRDSGEFKDHLQNVRQYMGDELPYAEGKLEAVKSIKLDSLRQPEHKCIGLRNFMKPEGHKITFDVVPNLDVDDIITSGKEEQITITTSTAKTDSSRIGWNKEIRTEAGISVTAEVSTDFAIASASLSTTISASLGSSSGQNGETGAEKEFRKEVQRQFTCPSNSICRIVTWTYILATRGTCFLAPFVDGQCLEHPRKGNYSLAAFPGCNSAMGIASQFYNINKDETASAFGPDMQGIKMHRPTHVTSNKYESNCSFSQPLVFPNNQGLVRTQAIIIQKRGSQTKPNTNVSQVPKAVSWWAPSEANNNKGACKLEDGWYWQSPNFFYIPTAQGGNRDWQMRDDLPKPEGLAEKCPEAIKVVARAEAEGELPPVNNLIEVKVIDDNMSDFISELKKLQSERLLAQSRPVRSPEEEVYTDFNREFTSMEMCLGNAGL